MNPKTVGKILAGCIARAAVVLAIGSSNVAFGQRLTPKFVIPEQEQDAQPGPQQEVPRPMSPEEIRKLLQLQQMQQLQLQGQRGQQIRIQQQQWGFQNAPELPVNMPTSEELRRVKIDPQLKAFVNQLDDPSFAVRQQATKLLVEATGDKLQLYAMLCRETDLTVEQRYRLLGVLRDQLVSTPRGALGISSNQMPVQWQMQGQLPGVGGPLQGGPLDAAPEIRGVRVDDLLPGMPAERVLRVGDRITHVNGEPLNLMGELTVYVQTRKPGDKVKLTVQRAKVDDDGKIVAGPNNEVAIETVEVDMELGSADMLNKIRPGGNQSSPVEINRLSEAAQAVSQYSPLAVDVHVRGGEKALLVATARPFGQLQQPFDIDPAVDRYPAIRDLLRDKLRVAQGVLPLTQALRQQWNLKFNELAMNAQKPGMTSESQSFMQSVLQRYQELMNEP